MRWVPVVYLLQHNETIDLCNADFRNEDGTINENQISSTRIDYSVENCILTCIFNNCLKLLRSKHVWIPDLR